MPPTEHALLSASSSARWLVCTPSARLEQRFGDFSGAYAQEGTVAHMFAECAVDRRLRGYSTESVEQAAREHELYSPEMEQHALAYAQRIEDVMQQYAEEPCHAESEVRVDYSEWVPQGFGTADFVCTGIDRKLGIPRMDVFDYKYGRGVAVSAEDNPQLKLYALGAIASRKFGTAPYFINLHVIQPRLGIYSRWSIDAADLFIWAEEYVRPRAELAYTGKGDCCPSDETCRFCRAVTHCKARREQLRMPTEDPRLLSLSEMAEMLEPAKEWGRWAKKAEAILLKDALEGAVVPGYKIVMGRRGKKRFDENQDLPEAAYKRVLKTPDELKREVGKSLFNDFYASMVIQDEGKPMLVPESDRRPEYIPAKSEF